MYQLLRCPLTNKPFCDPVVAEDGCTYERNAIEKWFETSKQSPGTREEIGTRLVSNTVVKYISQVHRNYDYENKCCCCDDIDYEEIDGYLRDGEYFNLLKYRRIDVEKIGIDYLFHERYGVDTHVLKHIMKNCVDINCSDSF